MLIKLKDNLKNYFSNIPKAMFVFTLIAILLVIGLLHLRKTIYVFDDGKESKIVTYRSNLNKILSDNDIAIGKKDKIEPGLNSRVRNNEKIYVKRAVLVNVLVDGKTIHVKSAENNVQDMLRAEKITFREDDEISLSLKSKLSNGMNIQIKRVDTKFVVEYDPIDYSTIYSQDDNLEKGTSKVTNEGEPGSKEITTKIIYEDNKEIKRQIVKQQIVKNPVNKLISLGTLGVLPISRGGDKVYYRTAVQVKATAYSAGFRSTGKFPGSFGYGMTYTGTIAHRTNNGYSTIAVDPKVIPLGSRVYVEGYGYAIAEDIGGAIKGNSIDVFFDSEGQALSWGVKYVTLYVLK